MIEVDACRDFWNWFVDHQLELLDFETDREEIFDRLAAELGRIDPNLTFEFGPPDTKREFVISAGGIKDSFAAVVLLVNAAPTLDHWHVTAFRPRRCPINIVEFGGKCIDPNEVTFTLLDNGSSAGIRLFIPGYIEGDVSLSMIGYLLLDEALGEFDVEARLGLIKMLAPDTRTVGERYPLAELPTLFDQLTSRLEGRSGTPS